MIFHQINSSEHGVIGFIYSLIFLLIAPNGKVASVFDKGVYTRYNAPTNARFDSLMQSPVGRAIAGLIQLDVNAVDTITHLSNLQQTNP